MSFLRAEFHSQRTLALIGPPGFFLTRIIAAGCLSLFLLGGTRASAQATYDSPQQRVDCSDPSQATSSLCAAPRSDRQEGPPQTQTIPQRNAIDSQGQNIGRDLYLDSAGLPATPQPNSNNPSYNRRPNDPVTDFQRLAKEATNELLPIFGRDLFLKPPSTFAPADQIQVTPDYVIGPGDEIIVRVWGHNTFNGRLTVDRAGAIYVPQVGAIHVAGLRYSELRDQIQHDLTRTFRNFELSVNLGQLRSIQIYVLGEAVRPGNYTVSSLSTAFNALLVSGGPTVSGSLRAVQVRRGGQTVATVDLYDFILRGDKSRDVTLQANDVLFIPVTTSQVAMSGSVRRPAIYEIKPDTTVADLLAMAGGLSATASDSHVSIERIAEHHDRQAMTFSLDASGLSMPVRDGDVLHIDSMLASYKNSVTIRGNLANAGRFPWREGMKLSDIIPERDALLTRDYWQRRNHLGIPTPMFQPLNYTAASQSGSSQESQRSNQPDGTRPTTNQQASAEPNSSDDTTHQPLSQEEQIAIARRSQTAAAQLDRPRSTAEETDRSTIADQQFEARRNTQNGERRNEINLPFPEIDWSYAVIERLDPKTLRSSLIPFNLGRLVLDHDSTQDLPLQPGDIVTIVSQNDVQVSQDERAKYVRLEGEFISSGVYSVGPDETLADVVRRAGGFTSKAYLYGATFSRESARVMQQQRLDEYISQLSIQIERTSAERAISATTPGQLASTGTLESEKEMIQHLRAMRATGRVVLEFKPDGTSAETVPLLPLENGDVFRVPSRPMMVSVVGAVYGQNVFLYNPARRARDYLTLAGKPTRIADRNHAFIIRADGSIFSKETTGGLWSDHFSTAPIYPGDTIVMPEKPIRQSALRDVIDWSQVFAQFAIGAAAIQVLK